MASGVPAPTSAASFLPEGLLYDLLEVSLTAVNVLRPVCGPAGEVEDFFLDYVNPAGQRASGLPERPGSTLLTRFPHAQAAGILDYYRRVYTGATTAPYEVNYQADGLDNYFKLAARRSGELLVVSFTDTADQDRSAVEVALRKAQAAEQAARAETEAQRQHLYRILENFPAVVASYRGPQHVFDLVSHRFQRDFPTRTIRGLPVREALPELEGQQYYEILDGVYQTGEPFYGTELETWVDLTNTGKLELQYYNVCFQATRNAQGQIDGILNFAYDVTDAVLARQQLEQLNQELETRVAERTQAALALQADLLAAAQRRVREREEFYQVFEQAPVIVALLRGPEHVVHYRNPAFQELFPGRALTGHRYAAAMPEIVAAGLIPRLDDVYATGLPYNGAALPVVTVPPGATAPQQRYYDFSYQAHHEADSIVGVSIFAYDVTEQVLARQEREAQQRRLYAVFEHAPVGIAIQAGPDLLYEYVNSSYQRMVPDRQLVGRTFFDAFPEMANTGVETLLRRVYETGETQQAQDLLIPVARTDGSTELENRYFTIVYQARRDEHGHVNGVLAFVMEVTEQVVARRQRDAERQKLLHLFTEAPAAICILTGPNLVFELVNPGYQELFPDRKLLGRPILDALPEIVDHTVHHTFRQVYETGITHEEKGILIPLLGPDGVLENRYFNYIQQARRGPDNGIDGVLVFAFEVTEQVQARHEAEASAQQVEILNEELAASNQNLHNTNEQLRRTNVDLDNFIYTASHDLKAPISNLEGLLYLLREELPTDVLQGELVAPTLTRMLDAVERFKRTIDHLTEVAKLQQAHAPALTAVDLAAVVEDVRLDLAPLLHETHAELQVHLGGLLPILFSEKNLRSVVYNLLSNALKYRHPDRRPHVDVRGHLRSGFAVLEVHDNGLGLAPYQLTKLFGMFERFHDHVEGTGIGLYMVKRMVENAGGLIEVHSQLGTGTTFFVYLPHTPA